MLNTSRLFGLLVILLLSLMFTQSAYADRFCYRLYDQNGAYEIYKSSPISLQTPPNSTLSLDNKRLVITVEKSCLRILDKNRVVAPNDAFAEKSASHPLLQTMNANPGSQPDRAARLPYQPATASAIDPDVPYYGDRSQRQSFTVAPREN